MSERTVFLSASFPDPARDPRFYEGTDLGLVREAVIALARVVLSDGRLVFGGHPTISPLIHRVASDLGRVERVTIHQSDWFHPERGRAPEEQRVELDSLAFGAIRWTPVEGDLASSLGRMRREMLGGHEFSAAVFIGGMEGVVEEWSLFGAANPGVARFPVGSTGGAARLLLERHAHELSDSLATLSSDLVYGRVFRELLG